jgi:flavin reductase (DIM6/NTAB) family NADH-FMN oxidoreductase RutF
MGFRLYVYEPVLTLPGLSPFCLCSLQSKTGTVALALQVSQRAPKSQHWKITLSPSQLASVLGRLPSGLFVLTARRGDEEEGMLTSWVMQAGFEPPMISVALRKDRPMAAWLAKGTPFVLNLLAEEQLSLVRHFGRERQPGTAFAGVPTSRTHGGLPLIDGSVGYLECEPAGKIESGDHFVFLARVVAGHLTNGAKPLVHIRKNGLKY